MKSSLINFTQPELTCFKYGYYIDYKNDKLGRYINPVGNRHYYDIPCMENTIQDYLDEVKQIDYENVKTLDLHGAVCLNDERQRLCKLLVQEIRHVRNLSNEEADWTLDIVSSNA